MSFTLVVFIFLAVLGLMGRVPYARLMNSDKD